MSSPSKGSNPNVSLDSNQLLSLCQTIRENMNKLDRSIKLAQLRLINLSYVGLNNEESSLKCSEHLFELSKLSQLFVQQLDELYQKLCESGENSINFQISSQQLMYFASEWYDNLTPKFEKTLEMADKYGVGLFYRQLDQRPGKSTAVGKPESSTETSARESLMRLKQSMSENERLIAIIASNIEYTRATIEAIYDSLQTTEVSLDAGERDVIETIGQVRESFRLKFIIYLVIFLIVALLVYVILRFFDLI